MKAITLTLFMASGLILFSSCSETKDNTGKTETEVKENIQTTEQPETISKEEMTMKEKAGEEVAGDKGNTENKQDQTKQLKVKDSELQSASFTAASMHCGGCESSIENSVKKLNGIQDVKASFDTKQVEVIYAGDKITKEEIAKAITDSGFECKINK